MSEQAHLTVWRVVEGAAALLVLGFFLFGLRDILNPFVLFFLLWALLIPFRGKPGHGWLVTVAAVLTLLWVLSTTGSLLAPFILAFVLAYCLDPLVGLIEARRIPRTVAIAALTLSALALVAALLLVAIPAGVEQVGEMIRQAPAFFQKLAGWVVSAQERLLRVDVPFVDEDAIVQRLRGVDSAVVVSFLEERWALLGRGTWSGVLGLGRGIGSLVTVGGYGVLTPVLTFYLLRDYDRIVGVASDLIPGAHRDAFTSFVREYDRLLSRYLRGQVTVAVALGLLTGVGLWIAGFPYAATLGLIVGIFSVVPYLGLLLSLIPAVFIALVSGSVGVSLLKVAIVYGVAQVLEGTVISPRIVGESVGLHPVWVVLALALGGALFGFVGLLLGVPGAVLVKLLIVRGLARYRNSDLHRGVAPPYGPDSG